MALEIERKFLVTQLPDLTTARNQQLSQGYLFDLFGTVIRVRKTPYLGYITIKRNTGLSTLGVYEYEYSIPKWLASCLLHVSFLGKIEKTRYYFDSKTHVYELDVFHGRNKGLCILEIELDSPDEHVDLPLWAGTEVTGDSMYYNKNLAKRK